MKSVGKSVSLGLGFFVCTLSIAATNVFTETGATEAETCDHAARSAARWVQQNALNFTLNKQQPSTGECSCRGNDKTGWACQVPVSY